MKSSGEDVLDSVFSFPEYFGAVTQKSVFEGPEVREGEIKISLLSEKQDTTFSSISEEPEPSLRS